MSESMNVNDLLDATLDDLDDLPSFEPFPAGAHRVKATMDFKEVPGHGTCVELAFEMIEVVELADPQANAPIPGSTCSTLFMLDNEFGVGNFKRCATPFGLALGLKNNREIIEQTTDIECVVVTSLKQDKKDAERFYLNVKEIGVV